MVSDYFAINEMITRHHIAANCAGAAKYAIEAGVDIELPYGQCYAELPALVRSGQVPESLIDEAVARVLRAKFELGLFDHPYTDESRERAVLRSREHRAAARESA